MPTKRYPLESGGPERLEITWSAVRFKSCTITFDGTVVATFPSGELGQEKSVRLPDGSWLTLQVPAATALVVKRNGALLPGSRQAMSPVAGQFGLMFGMLGLIVLVIGLVLGISVIAGSMQAAMNQYIEGALFIVGALIVAAISFVVARGLWRMQKWARIPAALVIGALELFLLIGLLLSGNILILIAIILIAIPLYQLFTAKEFNSPPPTA
ncbi:MAG TPA: hypothetical protein VH591_04875 [Ktedonobacterales bacterium]|jgi:hypothetical protein